MNRYNAYLPSDRLHSIAAGVPLPDRCEGTALFADVSGFTPLTEALVYKFGAQRGAEELTGYLNQVYDALISCLHAFGGSVISFAGDAITCWFDQDDGLRAAACALDMQAAMSQFALIHIGPGGTGSLQAGRTGPLSVSLTVKIALASGAARRFVVGDPDIQLMDVLAGETLYRLAAAEHHAEKGEIILDQTTYQALEGRIQISQLRRDPDTGWSYAVLEQLRVEQEKPPLEDTFKSSVLEVTLSKWLLPPVYKRLKQGQGEFLAELRPAIVLFLSFTGIDYDHDPAAGSLLDQYVRWAQRVMAGYDGYFFQLIVGDKGNYLYGAFGAPVAHEDDAVRAVSAALALLNPPVEQSSIQNVKIGISQGRLRTGAYGSDLRRTYGVLGDDVNLSARLMQAAEPGQILTNQTVKESAESTFLWDTLPAITVKGKKQPIEVFSPTGFQPRQNLRLQAMKYLLPMVGRLEELEGCIHLLETASQRNGQVLGVVGEAGVGKSRLMYELILKAMADQGMAYAGGECQSHAVDSSYWVWQPIWRSLFGLDPSMSASEQVNMLETKLAQIDPTLVDRLPLLGSVLNLTIEDNDLTRGLDAQLRKTSLESLLVDCLRAFSLQRPQLLVLEDCHWMDALSRDLVEVLGRAARDLPILIVLGYRPAEAQSLDQARFNQLPNFTEIRLREFTLEESRQLVKMKLTELEFDLEQVPESLINRILEQSQGNPFYIEELLNFIHDQSIDFTNQQALAALDLPTSLHSLILSRVDQLSDQQQITLKVASVIGRIFQAALLWGMYPDLGIPEQVKANLELLSQMQLTTLDPAEQELTYFFKQIVTQQVAYETLPYATRALLHGQLAFFIENNAQEAGHQFIDLLAFHYLRGENWPKALHYNLQAADRDQREFANEAGISASLNALQAASHLPAQDTLLERLQAHDILGELYSITGRYEEALESYATARQLAAERQPSAAKTHQQARFGRKTAEVYERRNEFERAFSWLQESLDFIDPQHPNNEAARIYHLGAGIYYRQGNYTDAITWCQESLEIAAHIPTVEGRLSIAHVNRLLGLINNRLGDFPKAIEYCQQSIDTFNELSDFVGLARAYNNLGINYSDQGDWEQSSLAYNKSLEINLRIGAIQEIGLVSNNLGNIYLDRGDWDRAASLFQQSNAIWKQLGALLFDAVTLSNLAQVYIFQGDLESGQLVLTESEHNLHQSGGEAFLPELERRWAELYLKKGDLKLALEHIQQSVKLARKQQDLLESGKSMCVLGEVYNALQEPDQAWQAFEDSLATLQALNSEYEIAHVQLEMAKLAAQTKDYAKGKKFIQAAKPVFEKLGAQADLAATTDLQKQIK